MQVFWNSWDRAKVSALSRPEAEALFSRLELSPQSLSSTIRCLHIFLTSAPAHPPPLGIGANSEEDQHSVHSERSVMNRMDDAPLEGSFSPPVLEKPDVIKTKGKGDSDSAKAILNLPLTGNEEEGSGNDSDEVLDDKQDLGSLLTPKARKGPSRMRLAPEADVIAKQLPKDMRQSFIALYDNSRHEKNFEAGSSESEERFSRANVTRTLTTRRNFTKNMLNGFQVLPVHLETSLSTLAFESILAD